MKNMRQRLFTMGCVLSLLMMAPSMTVVADELYEEEVCFL